MSKRTARRPDMDWLGLETRLRTILRETAEGAETGGAAWRDGIVRINAALAAYTRRGDAISLFEHGTGTREETLDLAEWHAAGVVDS